MTKARVAGESRRGAYVRASESRLGRGDLIRERTSVLVDVSLVHVGACALGP